MPVTDQKIKEILLAENYVSNEDIKVAEAVRLGSRDFLIKTDWQIADVVKKVKDKLKI